MVLLATLVVWKCGLVYRWISDLFWICLVLKSKDGLVLSEK